MGFNRILDVPYDWLKEYTGDFNEDNFIGNFQFGKIYRGKMPDFPIGTRELTVKIWEDELEDDVGDNESRLMDEVYILQHEQICFHPSMVKLIYYCWEGEKRGVIYALDSLDMLHNLVDKDSFTWLQRIKVAFGFACLLKLLHARCPPYLPFLLRNIDAAHIMVDKDYKPQLFDFSMITGGIFPDRTKLQIQYGYGNSGYRDPVGGWSEKSDVFAYGVLLLNLITKRVDKKVDGAPLLHDWARSQYKPRKSAMGFWQYGCSLVHGSLEAEPIFCSSDGYKITKLAMQCVELNPRKCPTMKQIVERLQGLRVVRRHSETLCVEQMLCDNYYDSDFIVDNPG